MLELLERGKGMVFLHHSLVSYQQWDEFINMISGRYYLQDYFKDTLKISGFEHDLDLHVKVLDSDHQVTKDMRDFQTRDEGYFNIEMIPSVYPLLEVDHPSSKRFIAWMNEYKI